MNWRLLASKEFGDAIRNYQLYAMAALFGLIFGVFGYIHVRNVRRARVHEYLSAPEPIEFVTILSLLCIVLIPAAGLMLSYEAIVKRRDGGQLTLLLGMPHDRRDVVIGSLVGRYLVFLAPLLLGVVIAVAILFGFGATIPLTALAGFTLATAGLGLAYVAIGIGLSGLLRSPSWAAVCAFGVFMLFVFVWRVVPDGVVYLVSGLEFPDELPWWRPYVATLSPSVAYERVLDAYVFDRAGEDAPTAFGVAVLLAWAILAPLAGYLQFDRTDL
ncbi:ABC transporter permease subunit [Natronosalvus halobius]|uniref:ABC transporter permease subunit n=1 Tax=Natronosalvus halobius TaxID=2953746 RepID=UPI00209C9E37|nr:ABC transporter permease subunit [Natronosalvus halobius]USZ71570.1 ABC transporter permease [Natronosalvus halobius]